MRKEAAILNWKKARTYFSRLTKDIPEEKWSVIPQNNYSNLIWQYGHILVSEYRLALLRVRGSRTEDSGFIPADFISTFAKGSQPDSHIHYTVSELVRIGEQLALTIEKESSDWSESFLSEKAEGDPHPMFSTRMEALEYAALHDFLHCGQIGILRRQLGWSSLG
ncbi:MAG TPA: DinB family protein [Leptospiraceae bacterium]|nr:DinB family protein [Leptospiraceae bacterium]HNF27233.1 DinB family protein [Leptospiraceae bacterium]HNI99095.1 DinB family protein [Leptospiraceae bacterium]